MSKLNTGTLKDIVRVAWIAAYGDVDTCVRSFKDGDVSMPLDHALCDNGILTSLVHYASHISLRGKGEPMDFINVDVMNLGGEFSGVSIIENSLSDTGISLDDSLDCTNGVANKVHYLLEAVFELCPKNQNDLYPNVTRAFSYTGKIKDLINNKSPLVPLFQNVDDELGLNQENKPSVNKI